jgi:ribosomal protein L7/L12
LRQIKLVKAIKKLRDVTGMGLKEAKDYVDKLIINR